MPLSGSSVGEHTSTPPVRAPNEERSFYKFIKKDFEDLSLGRIKRPKRQRKKAGAAADGEEHTDEEDEEHSVQSLELHEPVESHIQEQEPSHLRSQKSAQQEAHARAQGVAGGRDGTMGDAAHDAAAADAAAKWRAEKTQKSCMHSDKPDKNAKKEVKAWTTFEAGWRVSTLPFRLARNTFALSLNTTRLRPTWNTKLESSVGSLRTMYQNTPLTMTLLRMAPDRVCAAPDGTTNTKTVPVDLGGGLTANWTLPEGTRHHAEAARTLLFVHAPDTYPTGNARASLLSRLAQECQAAVLTVDYRQTPEYERDESASDLAKAYKWVASQPGVLPAQLMLGGEGIGAALAVELAVALVAASKKRGGEDLVPAAMVLVSPWVDLDVFNTTPEPKSLSANAEIDYVSPRVLAFVAESYAGLVNLTDPTVSPTHLNLKGLPPTFLSVGQCEILRDQAVAFSEKLQAAGTIVEMDEAEDMPHCFQLFAGLHPACQAGILRIAAFGRRMAPGQLRISIGANEADAWEGAQQGDL
eukprot:CAMPEP_0180366248 /NCGR_PEP_ID=MMETSP0989-20121125/15970_1 /TAXON_ID=697907 /ORGANISM="non described non described, Strain CCMP2293" /LENGTH=525 /DNA_ID=CAMNT_0022359763 /DNA_START=76 /DNA_END=1653 /DNA_ORIENTATION=-